MGLEFVYEAEYGSTIDTLALRNNVNRILHNTAIKRSAAKETYQASSDSSYEYNLQLDTSLNEELTSTINFLKSEAALKLLNLTKRHASGEANETAEIIDLKIDESKANIFAA